MKKLKKAISVIIAVVMVVSVFSALPLTVNAVGNILRKAPTVVSGDYQYEVRDDVRLQSMNTSDLIKML